MGVEGAGCCCSVAPRAGIGACTGSHGAGDVAAGLGSNAGIAGMCEMVAFAIVGTADPSIIVGIVIAGWFCAAPSFALRRLITNKASPAPAPIMPTAAAPMTAGLNGCDVAGNLIVLTFPTSSVVRWMLFVTFCPLYDTRTAWLPVRTFEKVTRPLISVMSFFESSSVTWAPSSTLPLLSVILILSGMTETSSDGCVGESVGWGVGVVDGLADGLALGVGERGELVVAVCFGVVDVVVLGDGVGDGLWDGCGAGAVIGIVASVALKVQVTGLPP